MKRIRRQHTAEFKAQAVRLVEQTGRPATVVARELGLHPAVLQGWIRATPAAPGARGATDASLADENRRLREENAQLRDERDLLKKSSGVLCERVPIKCAFIHAHRDRWSIVLQCRVLGVSRARYYQWRLQRPTAHAVRDTALLSKIHVTFAVAKRRYGSPRVHAELAAPGEHVGVKRVARLMRAAGLQAKRRTRFHRTPRVVPTWPVAPNLVARPFQVRQLDQVWGADMTFLATREGWLYLAVILDLCSRRVVGWALDTQLDQQLALRALEVALAQRGAAHGVTHHSDRGTPYASHAYRARLTAEGMVCSMSRAGDCWDNAMVESFFATLKTEADQLTWPTRAAARAEIGAFIEGWYNRRRRHSALGALSPVDFERQHAGAA